MYLYINNIKANIAEKDIICYVKLYFRMTKDRMIFSTCSNPFVYKGMNLNEPIYFSDHENNKDLYTIPVKTDDKFYLFKDDIFNDNPSSDNFLIVKAIVKKGTAYYFAKEENDCGQDELNKLTRVNLIIPEAVEIQEGCKIPENFFAEHSISFSYFRDNYNKILGFWDFENKN